MFSSAIYVSQTCGCIHVATNTCEIERVVKQAERGCYALAVLNLERSLLLSRSPDLKGLPQVGISCNSLEFALPLQVPLTAIDDAVHVIVRQKTIERCTRVLKTSCGQHVLHTSDARSCKYNDHCVRVSCHCLATMRWCARWKSSALNNSM